MVVKINRKVPDEQGEDHRKKFWKEDRCRKTDYNNTCYHYDCGDHALSDSTGRTDKP